MRIDAIKSLQNSATDEGLDVDETDSDCATLVRPRAIRISSTAPNAHELPMFQNGGHVLGCYRFCQHPEKVLIIHVPFGDLLITSFIFSTMYVHHGPCTFKRFFTLGRVQLLRRATLTRRR